MDKQKYIFCVVCYRAINGCECVSPRIASLITGSRGMESWKKLPASVVCRVLKKKRKEQIVDSTPSPYLSDKVCWLCEMEFGDIFSPLRKTRDHVIPKVKGGQRTRDNIRAAHRLCNEMRGHQDVTEGLKRRCRKAVLSLLSVGREQ